MKIKQWIVGLSFALGLGGAQACGPEFPLMLTTCRSACLKQIKAPGFVVDMARLVAPGSAAPPAVEDTPIPATSGSPADEPSEAKRLYDEGAKEFNRVHRSISWDEAPTESDAENAAAKRPADEVDQGLTAAIDWFERVAALPPTDAEPRVVRATYMLARSHFLRDRPGDEEIAVQEYRKTIDLVEKGHMDNLGLGNYSLGELGRIALKHDRFGEAVALYARQVAGGSQHAIDSLWWVTQKIPNDTAVLEREIGDPLFQKFLIAYALSRADGTCSDKESRSCGEPYTSALSEQRAPQTAAIVEALGQLDPRNVQWPDQAAALAYSVGNFAVASRLLKVADSPYAEWIRAKMALHAGDLDDAAQAFARASKNFASSAQAAEAMPLNLVARLRGEHSVLLLSRGDYIEALYQLSITHHFRDDALYVAERVLTLDELKSLVDKEVWADSYRDLLARRLARANRFDEAMQYYRDRAVSLVAAKYVEARHQAVSGSTPLARAQGWYQVAQLEITSGMELLGTERCPDYSEYEGNYGSACDEMAEITGELTIPDEVDRVKSSAAAPDARFHYRSVAVAHLLQAAELLPKRSKLMSAVLCNGVAWLQRHNRSLNEDLIQAVYRRYRQDGRAEPWTQNFGATCVEPDFAH